MPDVIGLYWRFGVRLPDLNDGWASTRCFAGRHDDRHPSARVHLRSGGFRCFACDIAGGVLDALEILGCDRAEARRLAFEYGIIEQDVARRRPRPPVPGLGRPQPEPKEPQPAPSPAGFGERVDYDHVDASPVRDRTWEYADEHGEPVGRVRRLDLADGTKRIWQERRDGDGWAKGLDGRHLPLYRLPDVIDHARRGDQVVVVEGEKAVDALARIGLFATTNPGGAGKWRDEHTVPLACATVVPIADCDPAGRDHARHVAGLLITAGVTCGMPVDLAPWRHDGFDVVDYLAELADTIRAVDPDVPDLHDRLREHLQRLLNRALPATPRELQLREELDRHHVDLAGGTVLAYCERCAIDRVHTVRAGVAYCPCGAHRPPP